VYKQFKFEDKNFGTAYWEDMFKNLPKFPAYVKQADTKTKTIGVTFKFDMEGMK
jgi:hypothetical protein